MNSASDEVFAANSSNDSSPVTHRGGHGAGHGAGGPGVIPSNTIELTVILKSVILFCMMIISIFGNGLVLAAIRTTPSLWTKTNKILASLTVADFWAGLTVAYYVPISTVSSLADQCSYKSLKVVQRALTVLPAYASCFNLIIVAIDRYVAIVYPLEYEMKMTDRVVTVMIAAVWLISSTCAGFFVSWLINADQNKCSLIPVKYFFMDTCLYMLVGAVVAFVYGKILAVAWHQHVAIEQTTAVAVTSASGEHSRLENNDAVLNVAQQHQQQKKKLRKAEFKALRLTSVIIGAFLVLWLPYEVGRGLQFVGDNRPLVAHLVDIGSSTGWFNSSFNWILYGAVNRTFQKAFRRLLAICVVVK